MSNVNKHRVGELIETLESINYQLARDFGKQFDNRQTWRVVWSDTETEKRKIDVTNEGFQLLTPEIKEVKKYPYISERYVLERLVPVMGETDIVTPLSYEPAWTFEDRHGKYLPPRFDACKYIIEAIYSAMDKKGTHVKYKDPDADPEHKQKLIAEMEYRLFGDESPMGDALSHGDGISYAGMKNFAEEKANG